MSHFLKPHMKYGLAKAPQRLAATRKAVIVSYGTQTYARYSYCFIMWFQ